MQANRQQHTIEGNQVTNDIVRQKQTLAEKYQVPGILHMANL